MKRHNILNETKLDNEKEKLKIKKLLSSSKYSKLKNHITICTPKIMKEFDYSDDTLAVYENIDDELDDLLFYLEYDLNNDNDIKIKIDGNYERGYIYILDHSENKLYNECYFLNESLFKKFK